MTKTMKELKREERELMRALVMSNSLVEKESYKGLIEACRMMINREERR